MGGCLSSDLGGVYVGKGGVSVVPPFVKSLENIRFIPTLLSGSNKEPAYPPNIYMDISNFLLMLHIPVPKEPAKSLYYTIALE